VEKWGELLAGFDKQKMVIRFKNRSVIYLRSADRPDNLRGPNLSWFYIDEAAKVPHKVWKIMLGRLRVAPEQGWITTTPRGRNWVWQEFARKPRHEYEYFVGSTAENLTLSTGYKDSIKDSYSGSFLRQEFYGEFIGWEGLVYNLDMDKHDLSNSRYLYREDPDDERKVWRQEDFEYGIAGVDWGWIDPMAISVAVVRKDSHLHLVDEFCQNKTPIEKVVLEAKRLAEKWKIRTFFCDPSRPEYIQEFRNAGLDARKGKNDLDPGIAIVNRYLATETEDADGNVAEIEPLMKVDFTACEQTVEEFAVYHYEEDDEGRVLKAKPVDADNHLMDAVRYMVYGFEKRGHVSSRSGNR